MLTGIFRGPLSVFMSVRLVTAPVPSLCVRGDSLRKYTLGQYFGANVRG